jgi:hypothetical protein
MALESFADASQAHQILAALSLWLILPTHLLPGVIMFPMEPWFAPTSKNFRQPTSRCGGARNVKSTRNLLPSPQSSLQDLTHIHGVIYDLPFIVYSHGYCRSLTPPRRQPAFPKWQMFLFDGHAHLSAQIGKNCWDITRQCLRWQPLR